MTKIYVSTPRNRAGLSDTTDSHSMPEASAVGWACMCWRFLQNNDSFCENDREFGEKSKGLITNRRLSWFGCDRYRRDLCVPHCKNYCSSAGQP